MSDAQGQASVVTFERHHAPLLLAKLNASGFCQIYLTVDEEEVVTAKELRRDIEEVIQAHNGRASSEQLTDAVGVDEAVVVAEIGYICAKDPTKHLVDCGGSMNIVTDGYLEWLADQIQQSVALRDRMTTRELSSAFHLPTNFMERFLRERADDTSGGVFSAKHLVGDAVITESYEQTKRSELYAMCSSASDPCSLTKLMRACDFHPGEEDMIIALLTDLTQSGELEGSVTAAREYVPHTFTTAQREAAYAFFAANGYLDAATASSLQVRKLREFIQEKHPDAECLETFAVSKELMEQLEAVADEAVVQESWFEAWAVLPTTISDEDAALLLGKCAACKRAEDDPLRVVQLAGVYGASNKFVEDIADQFRLATLQQRGSEARVVSAASRKEPQSNKGKSGGRRNKDRRKGGRRQDTVVSEEDVRSFISSCKAELMQHPRLLKALSAHLAPRFSEAKADAIRLAQEGSGPQAGIAAFEASFENKYAGFQLSCRGVQALASALKQGAGDGSDLALKEGGDEYSGRPPGRESKRARYAPVLMCQAEAYLVRTKGAELAETVTCGECDKLGIAFATQNASQGKEMERMPIISQAACSALTEVLPDGVGKALARLWAAAMGGDQLSVFCEILQEVLSTCNLVGRRLDKRKERQIVAADRRTLKEKLFNSVTERDVLHYVTMLVFQSVAGAVPVVPERATYPLAGGSNLEGQSFAHESKEFWADVLLDALRGGMSSQAEKILLDLQRDVQLSEGADGVGLTANIEGLREDGRGTGGALQNSLSARLLQSTEAARSFGLNLED